MKWDEVTLIILAIFGCITLLLTQISEVLSRLPQIIRAWRQVRCELTGRGDPSSREDSGTVAAPDTRTAEPLGRGRIPDEPEAGRHDG